MSDTRAVSDVIAFVLVFSIIITSVGALYAVGFGSLNDLQEGEQNANAERSMTALAVAMDDVLKERAGDRAADIDLAGRTMGVDDGYELDIEVDNGSTTSVGADEALVYGIGADTKIVYHAGAVIRVDPDGAIVTRGPRMNCRANRDHATVTVPTLDDANDEGGISSDGSVRVDIAVDNRLDSTLVFPDIPEGNGDVNEVRISVGTAPSDVQPQYEDAWQQWFERDDNGWEWDSASNEGVCDLSGEGTVFVRNPEIDITYIR